MRGAVALWMLAAASSVGACFGGNDSTGGAATCERYCENACEALEGCSLDAGTNCIDDCTGDLAGVRCGELAPLDRLTCPELERSLMCAAHCGAVCARAAECGSFDAELCVLGCSTEVPSICNEASAAARDCDAIKLEARGYEAAGRALGDSTSDVGRVGGTSAAFGLCDEPSDCERPKGCSLATNTCGACVNDAECDRGGTLGGEACVDGECVAVECVRDDQCLRGVCDAEQRTCVECHTDEDCEVGVLSGVCDVARQVCAQCRTNAECTSNPLRPACDTASMICVECTSDEDCAQGVIGGVYHACDAANFECVACLRDEHCEGDSGGPACDTEKRFCVECVDNAHCTSPARPVCGSTHFCQWCVDEADCEHIPGRPYCALLSGCVGCRNDDDCTDPEAPTCNGSTCGG